MDDRSRRYGADETGTIHKNWKGRIRMALVYPNHYAVGMSNLGFQSVYRLANGLDQVLCERAFLPDGRGKKPIRAIESGRSLSEFHIVAFSISFEMDFPNVLAILHMAGLPLPAAGRGSPHPLVMAGGVACFLNPEPIAPFIDCFLIGEAEPILAPFLDAFDPHRDRGALLEQMAATIPGIYVPAFYRATYHTDGTLECFTPTADVPESVVRSYQNDLSHTPTCSTVLTPHTTFKNTCLIEVARGCPHGCRFCSAGFIYRPPRFSPLPLLERSIRQAARRTDRIGLVSTAVSNLPGLLDLCQTARELDLHIAFSSLRTDDLTPEIIAVLGSSGVKTATLAPDAGSERMRRVINKNISEDALLDAVTRLVSAGILNVKLYFMVGLPTETMDDVAAIVTLCKTVKRQFLAASRIQRRIGTITVSLNAFVPKAFTPFQWAAMDPIEVLQKKIRCVRDGLRRVANVTVKTDPIRNDRIQALLARGDRRVADLLVRHHQTGGTWPQTLKASPIPVDFYTTRKRSVHELLPWDFIDHGIKKSFLENEYRRALRASPSAPCPMKDCSDCGICRKVP